MFVKFWGTRGSIPTPGAGTARYGGNTSCVELRSDDGNLFVFDCGTGIRQLGLSLLGNSSTPPRIHILIGHTHWDHIQGFPFFTPVFLPGTEINIYAPLGFQRSLEEAMSGQMQYSYFPVKLQDLSSRIHYTELDEGFFRIGDCLVETQYLNHTAPTIAYRLTEGNTSVAYVTDHEPFWKSTGVDFEHPGDQRHVEFIRDTDLVIHDAQYSEEEYQTKVGWGHSPISYVMDVALAAGVRRLALTHHDPSHDDDWIDEMARGVRAALAEQEASLEIFAAADGLELEIEGQAPRHTVAGDSALRQRSILGGRVLVISSIESDFTQIEHMLVEDGLILMPVGSADIATKRAKEFSPDLVILDAALMGIDREGFDGESLVDDLRKVAGGRELPILLLTDGRHQIPENEAASDDATDYLERPFSPPMLRSRVRAWLARTLSEESRLNTTPVPVEADEPFDGTLEASESRYVESLARTKLFRHLDPEQLEDLVTNASEQVFPPGFPILREGESGTSVFIILSGRVRVMETVPEGPTDMFLGEMGVGELFGEVGFLRETPRSATVLTLERTRCLVLSQEEFLETLDSSTALCIALLRVLAGRLADADRLLARYAPDPLTGLPGRRAFHDLYFRLGAGARRRDNSVILILLDVQNLRSINDEFGYAVGDDVLKTMAESLLESSRATDLVARYGSDEFAVLLIDAEPPDRDLIVERVNEKLGQLVTRRSLPVAVRYDIGMAVADEAPESVEVLLRSADDNIQKMKKSKTTR